jgi:hypothetical protein
MLQLRPRAAERCLQLMPLNERHGVDLWETRLQGFLAHIQRFPRLGLVLTVRDTYLHYLPLEGIEHLVHHGFAGRAVGLLPRHTWTGAALRGPAHQIWPTSSRTPSSSGRAAPYLDAENLKQLPKGLEGITAIFDFYLSACAKKVERQLRLVPLQKTARKALDGFLDACATHGDGGGLPLDATIELLERFHESGGSVDRSLLSAFLSEGVLTQDVERHEGGIVETIRFTFERLSDHLRAERLIAQINPADLEGSFRREPLATYFGPDASWRFAGVIEALAVQFPEQFKYELFDVLPEDAIDVPSLSDAFISSLAWRCSQSVYAAHGSLGVRSLQAHRAVFVWAAAAGLHRARESVQCRMVPPGPLAAPHASTGRGVVCLPGGRRLE